MANEKITYRSIFKKSFKEKGWLKRYALFTLVILALAFVTIYLNSEIPFLGAIILIVFLIPLVITYTEYAALVETKSPTPRNFRGFQMLFTNTYRSGRVRVILTFKTIIKFFLFLMLGMFVIALVFYFIIMIFDPSLFGQIQTIMNEMMASQTPELMMAKLEAIEALLIDYEAPFFIVNQLIQVGILIYFVNHGIFQVFTSIFIQQQPMTSLTEINRRFFSDPKSKKVMRNVTFINVFAILLLYGLIYTGSFLLLYFNTQSLNLIMQAELIAIVVLVVALPFVVRFNFHMYQALSKTKEVEIMQFTIEELTNILRSPYIPEESRPYIAEVLKMKKSELERLLSMQNKESSENTVVDEEKEDDTKTPV